ncbi:hypothetical protein DPX16_1681 [Anabarilius grahami]|uniref:Gypsy retrotransposon integrase-like protein 1 n=1 Tax=Anabarilius grahami TaxID=495550 RepID=A0A3N0XJA5_ANAGA|nr:hypothetical protein DPX16_1681 [Anabarilius grahami]
MEPWSVAARPGDSIGDGEPFTSEQLRQQQANDRVLVKVRGWLEAQARLDWPAMSSQGPEIKTLYSQWGSLELHDSVIYRWWQAQGGGIDRLQLLVPHALRSEVLHWVHRAAGAGHFGNSKTVWRLRQRFYWSGCRQHQRDWDQHLPLVLWAYRTAVQELSQCTPAALIFGRELRMPLDLVFGSPPEPEIAGGLELEYFRRLKERNWSINWSGMH